MLGNEGYKHKFRMCDTDCFFHGNNGYANVPQCYVISTSLVLPAIRLSKIEDNPVLYKY